MEPRIEAMESRLLLTIYDIEPNDTPGQAVITPLTKEAPGFDSGLGSIALSQGDSYDDWYIFSVPRDVTATISVTLQPLRLGNVGFSLTVANYSLDGGHFLYDSGSDNISINHVHEPGEGNLYYVDVHSFQLFGKIDDPYQLTITTDWDAPPPPPPPPPVDVAMQSAELTDGAINFKYGVAGNIGFLPLDFVVFQSSDTIFDASDLRLSAMTTVRNPPPNSTSSGTIPFDHYTPNPSHPFLLLVADPPFALLPNGFILETNESNNVAIVNNAIISPHIRIINRPSDGVFHVSSDVKMPAIQAELVGVTPDPGSELLWSTQVKYTASDYPRIPGRRGAGRNVPIVKYDDFRVVNDLKFSPLFTIGDVQIVRGGTVILTVRAVVGGATIEISTPTQGSSRVQILGRNPDRAIVRNYVNLIGIPNFWPKNTQYGYNKILGKLVLHESQSPDAQGRIRQFDIDGVPLWSRDGKHGVGIMQLTNPAPSDDQVWDWRQNVEGGARLFDQKIGVAIRQLNTLRTRVQREAALVGAQVPPITGDMIVLQAIRAYNGFNNGYGNLDEWREVRDADDQLVIVGGQTRWERRPALERVRPELRGLEHEEILAESSGNYRYVDDILGTPEL